MRIGILADIHEAVELLEVAIERLAAEGVDRLIVLGDVFETGPRLDETTRILKDSGSIGVFGNHDFGLSREPSDYIRGRFSEPALDYMTRLRPRMELEGCFFAHREPWLDCSILTEVWHVHEEDLPAETFAKSFEAAAANRAIFIGHYHRWKAVNPAGPLAWDGSGPLALPADSPTMVIVAAVCDGYSAVLDTEAWVLTPIDLYEGRIRPERRPIPPLLSD